MNSFEIDRRHTILFFITAVVVCAYGEITNLNFILKQYPMFVSAICFFLIATIGVSHGALDNLKGAKLLKKFKIKNVAFFYLIYSIISIFIIMFWIFVPSITLFLFLIIASYHFGKEDNVKFYSFEKLPNIKLKFIFLFFKGSLVISAPLWLHPDETIQIFKILNVDIFYIEEYLLLFFVIMSLISNFFINQYWGHALMDSFSILFFNLIFSPLIAFTFYFCFLHSIRHALSLVHEMDKKNFTKGLYKFIRKMTPLTTFTAGIFLISFFLLINYFSIQSSILKVIFIGLASLTFPHILLEYLIEKNERKRT
tara:strand:- start:1955 stop:2887 length:933 start_codon:yes stop_codon:yes gene_type:complete